ncbi:hypothetical protein F5Y16DRAFT_383779 [Xylariaceae sp. FL0255]|nr:hypothetical protein F5Y16DRAFT_383779 [Xylariaceae sp. FL0255]
MDIPYLDANRYCTRRVEGRNSTYFEQRADERFEADYTQHLWASLLPAREGVTSEHQFLVDTTVFNTQYWMTVRYRALLDQIVRFGRDVMELGPEAQAPTLHGQCNRMVHNPHFENDTLLAFSGNFRLSWEDPGNGKDGADVSIPWRTGSTRAQVFQALFKRCYGGIHHNDAAFLIYFSKSDRNGPFKKLFRFLVCWGSHGPPRHAFPSRATHL